MSLIIPFSEACERNKDPIFDQIQAHLERAKTVLEIGTGTGQHALYFAERCPNLVWQPTDQYQHLEGIQAQLNNRPLSNIAPVVELQVEHQPWFTPRKTFDLIYSANTLHIMNHGQVREFFKGLPDVSHAQSELVIYGPFKINGKFTSRSNAEFDRSLQAQGVGSGIRELEEICQFASDAGFELVTNQAMPANNQCLIWRRVK